MCPFVVLSYSILILAKLEISCIVFNYCYLLNINHKYSQQIKYLKHAFVNMTQLKPHNIQHLSYLRSIKNNKCILYSHVLIAHLIQDKYAITGINIPNEYLLQ